MKTLNIAASAAALGLVLCLPIANAARDSQAALKSEAKISESQAQATALAKVRNGSIKSAELEKEHGRLVWSFDIAAPSAKGVTEVQVDARTGKVVHVHHETAKQEAREAKVDRRAQ